MDARHRQVPRDLRESKEMSFSISSQTPSLYGAASSPYFSQATPGPSGDRFSISQKRDASFGQTPTPSSSRLPVPGTDYSSSYEYYGEPSQTASRSLVTRPSTSYTGRTSRTPFLPRSEKHTIVCALNEGRGITPTVGAAFFNVDTGEAILSQISDNRFFVRTLHKLQIMEPSHLLIVSSCCPPNPKSRLYSHIEEHMPDTKIIPFDRRHWSEVEGLDRIQTLAFREDAEAVKVAIEGSFFATCSFSAVSCCLPKFSCWLLTGLKAVEFLEVEFSLRIIPNSLRVRYQPSEDTMMIDVSAIISLEILQNLRASKSKDSLFGILKHTRTPMGSRVLRSNLLQPSTLKDSYLEPRYDALDELLSNHEMFLGVREGQNTCKLYISLASNCAKRSSPSQTSKVC